MKVSIRSILKTSSSQLQCFQQGQIILRFGNMLCIKQIGRSEDRFILLKRHINHLYNFKPSINRKGIYTTEKHGQDIEISYYGLGGDRKSFNLNNESMFFMGVEEMELLVDEYDNNLIYGVGKKGESDAVFILDLGKMKIMAIGYLPIFEDVKVDGRDNMALSICGHNGSHSYVKRLKYGLGQWEVQEQGYKKVQDVAIQHEILPGNRVMIITRSEIFLFEESQCLQIINLSKGKRRIIEGIRVPKGILIRYDDDTLQLLLQDSDQITFIISHDVQLSLSNNQHIQTITSNQSLQQIYILSNHNNIYTWRCDHLTPSTDLSQLIFNRVLTGSGYTQQGCISISTGKKYCLLTSNNNVTLCSLEKNNIVLSMDYNDSEGKKILLAGAINPDGNSILLAFQDKIKLYCILFTKFKLVKEFNVKRCQNIVYSHGGQLAACRFGKGINACVTVLNMLRGIEQCTFKVQSEPRQIIWNQLDDELIISTETNIIQIYRIAQNIKLHHLKFSQDITQIRIDYKTKQILVSSLKQIYILQNGKIIQTIPPPIQNFHYIFPLYGVYFATTKSGELLWSHSIKFQTYHQLPLFSNSTFNLVCRNGYLVAWNTFQNVLVLQCDRVGRVRNATGEQIVLIQREQILSFFNKVKAIQSNFDALTAATQVKLDEEKTKYEMAVDEERRNFKREVVFLKQKAGDLGNAKLRQERENEKIFQKLQDGQVKSIIDIERMYDRKLELEKEKYLTLEQTFLEQKLKYEKLVFNVEKQYHKQVGQVRAEYGSKVTEEGRRIEAARSAGLEEKVRLQSRLLDLEQESERALVELQNVKEGEILILQGKYSKLQEEYQQVQIILHNQGIQLQDCRRQADGLRVQSQQLREHSRRLQGRINLLQGQLLLKNRVVAQKDQILQEQRVQIVGLQKAKYVLSFRTTQIRKELQPREEQVEKLKGEIAKLEEEFREERQRSHLLKARMEKLERLNQIGRRETGDLKINLRHRQRAYQELCSRIFTLVNNVQQKQWSGEVVRLYQQYVQEDGRVGMGRAGKGQEERCEQLNRHLVHVEESLVQVTAGTEKVLRGKEKEVVRKMKENSELVYELNVMRKKQNEFSKEKKELLSENARLKRDLDTKSTSRSHTANTGFTRRVAASKDGMGSKQGRERSLNLEIHQIQKSRTDLMKSSRVQRSRLVSTRRTLMVQDQKKQRQSKIFDIARELQVARNTIKRQDRMIEELNDRLLGGSLHDQ